MNINIEKLIQEREKRWQYVEEYKARIKFPLHPITERRMKNGWLTHKIVTSILNGVTLKDEIEKILDNFHIFFTESPSANESITLINIETLNGTSKILAKK